MTNDVVFEILDDHKIIKQLYSRFQTETDVKTRQKIANTLIREINVHAAVEEMVFYPAIGKYLNDGQDLVDHTRHDHEVVKTALDKLDCIAVIDPEYEEKLRKAMKNLFEHVREEEEEILPKFKKVVSGKILEELGKKFNEARRHYVPPRPHPSVSETEKSCKENNAQENATVTDKNEPCEYVDTGQVC